MNGFNRGNQTYLKQVAVASRFYFNMPQSQFVASFRETRIRFMACIGVLCLSIDALNPIKVLSSVAGIPELGNYVSIFVCAFAANLLYANAKDFTYYSVKIFFTSILNIFFSSIEVLGRENIPSHGPIIFCGNHMNQFVDGAVALTTCPHKINFLIAESSFSKPVVGQFARAIGAMPVYRPIDNVSLGKGKIRFEGQTMYGQGTTFSTYDTRDKLRPKGSANEYKIIKVISDTEALLSTSKGDASPFEEVMCQGPGKWVAYDILGFVDQSHTFRKVNEALAKGENMIIFPEGGSHDNTDLLPLKTGIASIAYGTLETADTNVTIIPIGLNYFRGHRFRGRVVVEYGQPITINTDLVRQFRQSKRDAYQALMGQVEEGMRSVIVTAPNYNELLLIHTTRRLYQRASGGQTTKSKQNLARRFSVAVRLMNEKYRKQLPRDLLDVKKKLEEYQKALSMWGIYDYQVANLEIPYSKLVYTFLHGLLTMSLASIPTIVLNAPVGVAAKYWAQAQAKKALAKSKVKVDGRDVLLTNKIVFSIMAIPILWVSYALVLYFYFHWELRTILVAFLCMPVASYIGIRGAEAGMVDLKDLRPAFLRLLPSFRTQSRELPSKRMGLVREVRDLVKKYGPDMGPLYYEAGDEWEKKLKALPKSTSEDALSKAEERDRAMSNASGNSNEGSVVQDTISAVDESGEGERVPSGMRSASLTKYKDI